MIHVQHSLADHPIRLGIVRAEGVTVSQYPGDFEKQLKTLLEQRRLPLTDAEEERRKQVRDMLRIGRYKPTGRGKPASEYLLRAAREGKFPRINAVVDVNNYISLKYLLPVSLWDLDKSWTRSFVFRLGKAGESFVFNEAGQTISVEDLVVGCRVLPNSPDFGEPIVNPVKDALATKTDAETRRVAAAIYAPATFVSESELRGICQEFAQWLEGAGSAVEVAWTVLEPRETRIC